MVFYTESPDDDFFRYVREYAKCTNNTVCVSHRIFNTFSTYSYKSASESNSDSDSESIVTVVTDSSYTSDTDSEPRPTPW